MLAIGAPFFLFERWEDLRRFFTWTVVVAVPGRAPGGGASLGRHRPAGGRQHDRHVATALHRGAHPVLGALGRSRWRLPAVALAVSFIAIAAAVGSRGPILSFGLALAVTLAAWLLRTPRKVAPVLAIAAVERRGGAVRLAARHVERAACPRPPATPSPPSAQDDRYFLVRQAFELIDEHPIRGAGVGAFSTVDPLGQMAAQHLPRALVGARPRAPSSSRRRSSWRSWGCSGSRGGCPRTGREQALVYILLAVFVFNVLAVQVSGNINDNRDFWGMLAIVSFVVAGGLGERDPAKA